MLDNTKEEDVLKKKYKYKSTLLSRFFNYSLKNLEVIKLK